MYTFTVKVMLKNYIGNVMDKPFVIKVLESVGIFLTYIYLNVIKHHYSSSNPHIYFKIYTLELFRILSLFFFPTFKHGRVCVRNLKTGVHSFIGNLDMRVTWSSWGALSINCSKFGGAT